GLDGRADQGDRSRRRARRARRLCRRDRSTRSLERREAGPRWLSRPRRSLATPTKKGAAAMPARPLNPVVGAAMGGTTMAEQTKVTFQEALQQVEAALQEEGDYVLRAR